MFLAMSKSEESTIKPQDLSFDKLEEMKEDHQDGNVGENDNDEVGLCPLFMEGLPRDFASNPQLAAIASLLVDSDADDEDTKHQASRLKTTINTTKTSSTIVGNVGGGKARRTKRRSTRTDAAPYHKQTKTKTSLGEAQLFLNMWKI